ncbi:MAG: zinc ribbon domain-containing protein [Anaerolineae bacterium]|nr:zinc ribbon domain-containing protein [Anaerolineae bacterium]
MKLCQNCNQENPEDSVFCISCGLKLLSKTLCPSCNKENLDKAIFCQYCGASLSDLNKIGSEGSISSSEPLIPEDNHLIPDLSTPIHDSTLGRMKFVIEEEIYISVICDNCHENVRISKDRCKRNNAIYAIVPPITCKCGTVADEVYDVTNKSAEDKNQDNKNKANATKIVTILTIVFAVSVCYWINFGMKSPNKSESTKTQIVLPTKISTQSIVSDNAEVKMVQSAPEWILIQSGALTEIEFESFQNQVFGARVQWKLEVDEVGNVFGYEDEVYISCYPYPEITSIGVSYINIYGITKNYGATLSKGDIITAECTITKFNNLVNSIFPAVMLENCTITK